MKKVIEHLEEEQNGLCKIMSRSHSSKTFYLSLEQVFILTNSSLKRRIRDSKNCSLKRRGT